MPGPVWFTGAIFQNPDSLNVPAGQLGAGTPLHWEGEEVGTGQRGRRNLARLEPHAQPRCHEDLHGVRHEFRRVPGRPRTGLPGIHSRPPRSGSPRRPATATSSVTSRRPSSMQLVRSGMAGATRASARRPPTPRSSCQPWPPARPWRSVVPQWQEEMQERGAGPGLHRSTDRRLRTKEPLIATSTMAPPAVGPLRVGGGGRRPAIPAADRPRWATCSAADTPFC